MAGKVFGKFLDLIGLEETVIDDEEEMEEEGTREEQPVQEAPARPAPRRTSNKVIGMNAQPTAGNGMKMLVYQPMSYEDTQSIIDNLKLNKPIVVNLESLENDVAQRVLDFMSGAVYALSGNIHKVSKRIFVLAPRNVDISGNIPDERNHVNTNFFSINGKHEN